MQEIEKVRRPSRGRPLNFRVLALFFTLMAPSAGAHGFGQRYDLPVPLWLYLAGAGAAVLLSFVVVGFFVRAATTSGEYARLNLLRWPAGRALVSPPVTFVVKFLSVVVFLLVITAGLIGTPAAERNLAPTIVWVIWWVGVAYVSALVGNIWAVINPWRILFEWGEGLTRRLAPDSELSLDLPYPERLGVWPGVLLFFLFAWVEIVSPEAARPSNIAMMILIYSFITWGGMALFGKDQWLRRGEAFTLVFGLLARLSPTEVRVKDPRTCEMHCGGCLRGDGACINCYTCFQEAPTDQRELNLRPFAAGLLRNERISVSMVVFVVLLLSTVTFDGFTATPIWASLLTGFYSTFPSITAVGTLGLLTFPLLFMALYLVTCALMPTLARVPVSVMMTAKTFVLTLVPIALAYHLAHYFTYLLVQSQLMIPLVSDPFGFGWNLFGTANYTIDINVVGARFAWFTAVIVIVVGHIIAVYLAHVVALRLFREHQPALRSQYPMLFLMVGYTVISLWILAQPIVEVNPAG